MVKILLRSEASEEPGYQFSSLFLLNQINSEPKICQVSKENEHIREFQNSRKNTLKMHRKDKYDLQTIKMRIKGKVTTIYYSYN